MTDDAIRLWQVLLTGSRTFQLRADDLRTTLNLNSDELMSAISDLVRCGAAHLVEQLSGTGDIALVLDDESLQFLRCVSVEAFLINALNQLHGYQLLLTKAKDVAAKIRGELASAKAELNMPSPVTTIARELGLTAEQFEIASRVPHLRDPEIRVSLGLDALKHRWNALVDAGDSDGQLAFVAALGVIHGTIQSKRSTKISTLEATLADTERGLTEARQATDVLADDLRSVESIVRLQPGTSRERIPEDVRHEVWRRDEGCCVACGAQERLEFDHIIPISAGGSNTARNLQLLCEACNRAKGATI